MRTIFDSAERAALLRRIDALRPERPPRWGRMTAPEMVAHLIAALRAALGELPIGPPRGPWSRPPLNWLVIYVLPWPKGKTQSPPELLNARPTTWAADGQTLRSLLLQCGERGPRGAWPLSAAFGRLSGRAWGVMMRKHLDHHLRQFGV